MRLRVPDGVRLCRQDVRWSQAAAATQQWLDINSDERGMNMTMRSLLKLSTGLVAVGAVLLPRIAQACGIGGAGSGSIGTAGAPLGAPVRAIGGLDVTVGGTVGMGFLGSALLFAGGALLGASVIAGVAVLALGVVVTAAAVAPALAALSARSQAVECFTAMGVESPDVFR